MSQETENKEQKIIESSTNSLSKKFSKHFFVSVMLLGICASLLFFYYAFKTQKDKLYQTIDREITATTKSASLAAYTIDKLVAQNMLDGLTRSKGVVRAQILLEDGTILAQSGQNHDFHSHLPFTYILFPDFREFKTDLEFEVNNNIFNVGTLTINPNYNEATHAILRTLISGIIFIFLISTIIYFVVQKLIMRELSAPIITLAKEISSIKDDPSGLKGHQLPKPKKHDNDEIGFLIDNFNNLFSSLEESESYASDIQQTLETTEAQYTAMVRNTFELFMRISKSGKIEFTNPAVKDVLKYSLNEIINTNIFEYVQDDQKEKFRNFFEKIVSNTATETTTTFHFRTRDNEERILSCTVTNALEIDRLNSILFIARDITNSYKIEMELRQSQKLESIGKLTGGIAHDFNNILTIIINNIELVQAKLRKLKLEDAESLEKTLESALTASFGGADLTNRLLAFARNQPLNPDTFKPNERIKNILPLLERTIGNHISISADLTPNLGAVKIDKSQFENAILNLCINSRDAIPKGKKGSILIKTGRHIGLPNMEESEQVYILVEIIDNGEGISPENLKKVIDPFFTTKTIGKGTGLGLSMVYGFVHQSKGHFHIESEVDVGTKIQLFFPLFLEQEAFDIKQEIDFNPDEEYDGKGKTILILEDNVTISDIIEKLLVDMNFNVLAANKTIQAFDLYKQNDVDLILSDVLLQDDITGFDYADAIKEINPEQKIIHMSGYTDPENLLESKEYKVELRKPFRRSDLVQTIRTVFNE